jgi:hypothetical protein
MKTVKFAKDFKKLDNDNFSTLRLHDKYKEGEIYKIKTPSKEFQARLMAKDFSKLKEIPNRYLMKDTDTTSYFEALKQLHEFYPNITLQSEVVDLYFTKKIHRRED